MSTRRGRAGLEGRKTMGGRSDGFLGSFIVLTCAVLITVAAFVQQSPTKVTIRPTGPMPSISIP
jgi:hypothetical protein